MEPTAAVIAAAVGRRLPDLVGLRRDLHAHPETAWLEVRTTAAVGDRMRDLGLRPLPLELRSGLVADVVGDRSGPLVALRADLDALPVVDTKLVPYRSQVAGAAHACGHDVHTAALVGAAAALCQLAGTEQLPGTVRLIFQPAEEVLPGGARHLLDAGVLEGVSRVFALHCDPTVGCGRIGLRAGPITAAVDHVEVRLAGPGGHTARPHLAVDLVGALGDVLVRTPALLARRLDPRSGATLVWGRAEAGSAANVIPSEARAAGTVRILDPDAWAGVGGLVEELVRAAAAPYGAEVEVDYVPGVPPTVNDADAALEVGRAAAAILGPDAVEATGQSMGGEDFAWMTAQVPGALFRLGVRPPGSDAPGELHRGDFDVDEAAIGHGAAVLAAAAVTALEALA